MRARNIKPGFFKNEQLAELPAEARLLYVGLWCMADREGRLEDRPRRIKMEVFPADSIETEPLLSGLADEGLIVRYQIDDSLYIEIPRFTEHQSPHYSEKPSTIPPPLPEDSRKKPSSRGGDSGDLRNRHPLNPDSLNPESSLRETPERKSQGINGSGPLKRPQKRAPFDFAITDEMREWAAEHVPDVDIDRETEAFRDYEFPRGKSDWVATWRNWMRRAQQSVRPARATRSGGRQTIEEIMEQQQRDIDEAEAREAAERKGG